MMQRMLRRWAAEAGRTYGRHRARPAKGLFRLLFCLQFFVAIVACSPSGHSLPAQLEKEFTVSVDNTERTYRLFVPSSYRPDVPSPLVLVFHGGGMGSEMMADGTQFDVVAEAHNFIVAFPQGIKKLWYNVVPVGFANDTSIDDIAFVRAMLKQIEFDVFDRSEAHLCDRRVPRRHSVVQTRLPDVRHLCRGGPRFGFDDHNGLPSRVASRRFAHPCQR